MNLRITKPSYNYEIAEINPPPSGNTPARLENAENTFVSSASEPKLPPVPNDVTFTALGCDTEEKLARAAYMAAAAKAGISDVGAQRRFADQMLARNPPDLKLTKGNVELDDAQVKARLFNRSVNFTLSASTKAELREFRTQYIESGGRVRSNKNPTVDLRRQPPPAVDAAVNTDASPSKLKFRVLLDNTGNPTNETRILAKLAEDQYKGGNLWGENYRQIAELSGGQGVKPKITNVSRIGNQVSVEFELSTLDRAKIHENYKLVQAEVNRAVAAYENFANNNEISSFVRGVFSGAIESVKGTIGLITDLPGTLKALRQVVSNPSKTFNALKNELSETWEEFKNAPPAKKSEMLGELVGQAVVEILLGKGIGKAGGILAKTKTGANLIEKADQLKNTGLVKLAETFSDEAAAVSRQSARNRLRQLSAQLNSGMPIEPQLLRDLTIISGNKLKNGAVKFADFARQMIDEFGETIKPHIERLYRDAMTTLGRKIDETEISTLKLDDLIPSEPLPSINKPTRNVRLAGKNHPVTNVPFDRQGYPIFESLKDVKLPANMRGNTVSDTKQFEYATGQLRRQIEENPAMERLFTAEQLADIRAVEAYIDGLTWHHHQDGIRLQLVDRETHRKTGHDGGRKNTGGRP